MTLMLSFLCPTSSTHRQERVDEVRLDGGQHLALDDDGVGLVLVGGHQAAEPGPLGQLRR